MLSLPVELSAPSALLGSEKLFHLDALIGLPTIDFSFSCLRDSGQNCIKMRYNKPATKEALCSKPSHGVLRHVLPGLLTVFLWVLRELLRLESRRRPPNAVCIMLRRSLKWCSWSSTICYPPVAGIQNYKPEVESILDKCDKWGSLHACLFLRSYLFIHSCYLLYYHDASKCQGPVIREHPNLENRLIYSTPELLNYWSIKEHTWSGF